MSARYDGVVAAAEGAVADISWIIILVLCCVLMVAPFVLWYGGVRTPRGERRARDAVREDQGERRSA